MAAAAQVLNLPELLETILLALPTRDLFFAQKVCKTFKGVMDGSKNIQKALFFLPGTANDVNFSPQDIHHYDRLGEALPRTVVSNPLLFDRNGSLFELKSRVLKFMKGRDLRRQVPRIGARGSCTRMLLTQPLSPQGYIVGPIVQWRCLKMFSCKSLKIREKERPLEVSCCAPLS
ncbi:hypothetical protein LTR56_007412 [Elasticomyces elasticus]|nr:hypothetical protein LTR56_007412 [Elasticomyces elasticus]KAK3668048.1 hypothetical protein LTR22_001116 [Elasticomyces elasticus]KAK4925196.1 hypothetical protein LTR49_007734 [Elasticomyces elasticus]KAK5767688.1 hypothetical protein LTS12_002190 [Elasticomyces elasticus]